MERERQSDGNAIATELLAIADSWLFPGLDDALGALVGFVAPTGGADALPSPRLRGP